LHQSPQKTASRSSRSGSQSESVFHRSASFCLTWADLSWGIWGRLTSQCLSERVPVFVSLLLCFYNSTFVFELCTPNAHILTLETTSCTLYI